MSKPVETENTQASIDSLAYKIRTESISLIDEFVHSLTSKLSKDYNSFDLGSSIPMKEKNQNGDRIFVCRPSRLTYVCHLITTSVFSELLVLRDFLTVYNVFVAMLIVLGLSIIVGNYIESGQMLDFSLMVNAFRGLFSIAIPAWIVMFSWSILNYNLIISIDKSNRFLLYCLYSMSQISFCAYSSWTCLSNALPMPSGMIVMCEQVRLSMKLHSFFKHYLEASLDEMQQLSFEKFLYFLFAPTLLYRDSYPRNACIRWKNVFLYFTEVVFCILYAYALFERYIIPSWKNPRDLFDLKHISFILLSTTFPGTLLLLLGFYGILHCWLNAWAELLTFADRQFYRDWWNSVSWAEYYRKWNGVVHDWLYKYLYLAALNLFPNNKKLSKMIAPLLVFEISAFVHEFVIACALGYCYPVLSTLFGGPGVIFAYFAKTPTGSKYTQVLNCFMWCMLLLGNSIIMVLYAHEYYSRVYFQIENGISYENAMGPIKAFFMPCALFGSNAVLSRHK